MKKILGLVLGAILLTVGAAGAAEIRVSWSPYVSDGATELQILDKDTNVIWTGPTTDTTTTLNVPDECGSWYMIAANDTLESKNSNIIQWCPGLMAVTGLKIDEVVN